MNNHFAELGDVWKHLPLAEILRVDPPRAYWETHAGSASYPLTESPSRLHGALRFLSFAPYDPDLGSCAYLAALRHEPGVYPGSATLAMRSLGTSASYLFCDVGHAESALKSQAASRPLGGGRVRGWRGRSLKRLLLLCWILPERLWQGSRVCKVNAPAVQHGKVHQNSQAASLALQS
jgi:hypothetical protein